MEGRSRRIPVPNSPGAAWHLGFGHASRIRVPVAVPAFGGLAVSVPPRALLNVSPARAGRMWNRPCACVSEGVDSQVSLFEGLSAPDTSGPPGAGRPPDTPKAEVFAARSSEIRTLPPESNGLIGLAGA